MRSYGFNDNGNRTSSSVDTHSDGNCTGTADAHTATTYAYDTADRPTAGGNTGTNNPGPYSYDPLGRQTTIPAVDAPDPSKGDITLGYYDTDMARTITQGLAGSSTTTTYTLDEQQRRTTSVTGPSGSAAGTANTTTTVRHYTSSSDNPAWTDVTTIDATGTAQPAVTTRYTQTLTGDLGAQIGSDGTAALPLGNPHGDAVTTVTIPAGTDESTAAVCINGWADYTEYGAPTETTSPEAQTTVAGSIGYGWLGLKERSTPSEAAGLTLMGVRLYNPTRGQFTSLDPVAGGNPTAYSYPSDPINGFDLDGRWGWGWLATAAKVVGVGAAAACILLSAGVCAVAGALALGASAAYHAHAAYTHEESWGSAAVNFGVDAFLTYAPGFRFARYATRGMASQLSLVGRHAGARLLRGASRYVGRHGMASSLRSGLARGVRHAVSEYRANWILHPFRSAVRHAYNGAIGWRAWEG